MFELSCPECEVNITEQLSYVIKKKKCPEEKCGVDFELDDETIENLKVELVEIEKQQAEKIMEEKQQKIEDEKTPMEKATVMSDKVDMNETAINIIRQKLKGQDVIEDSEGSTYVSWYRKTDTGKQGKRFAVVYKHGRKIKAQFFHGIEAGTQPNTRTINPQGRKAYEYKSDNLKEFSRVVDSVL